jgi:plasmid stabilization system protein ParE
MEGSKREHHEKEVMNYQLEITDAAKQDLQESYDWYERKLSGLGDDFISAVEDQIVLIAEHPDSYERFQDDYRKVNTRRFPFKVIYSVKENLVTIWSVYHHSRDLKKWKR